MNTTTKTTTLTYLKNNTEALETVLADVSEAAFLSKPTSDTWSIAEIVEHIIKVETGVLGKIQQLGAAASEGKSIPSMANEDIMQRTGNRNITVQAPKYFEPSGLFQDKSTALAAFKQNRTITEKFVEMTELDLKSIGFPHMLLGILNGENWLVFIAGHSERHVTQIKQLKEMT